MAKEKKEESSIDKKEKSTDPIPQYAIKGSISFSVSSSDLQTVLTLIKKHSSTGNVIPALKNVYCKIEKEVLSIYMTNLDAEIRQVIGIREVNGEVEDFLVPIDDLFNIVKVLTIEEVAIRVENTIMTIEEGFNIFKITLGPNAKEFPVAVKDTKSGSITLDYPKFFKLLTEASGFTSNNVEGYKMLDGVYIQLDGNRFKATATDRSSMYHGEIKLSESYDAHNFIIPSSFISILKSMGKKDEKITINFSKERIWFSLGIIEVRCLLLTGKYPDWQKIVPRSHTIQIEFKKDELETGIKKIASVSKSNSRSAKLEISEKNTTFISMSIEYQQEARIVVPCSIEGEIKEEIIPQAEGEPKILKANTIGLNYHYIKNAIDVLGGERIYVRCSSQRKAAIFLGEGTDIEAFILIMPVTLPY